MIPSLAEGSQADPQQGCDSYNSPLSTACLLPGTFPCAPMASPGVSTFSSKSFLVPLPFRANYYSQEGPFSYSFCTLLLFFLILVFCQAKPLYSLNCLPLNALLLKTKGLLFLTYTLVCLRIVFNFDSMPHRLLGIPWPYHVYLACRAPARNGPTCVRAS